MVHLLRIVNSATITLLLLLIIIQYVYYSYEHSLQEPLLPLDRNFALPKHSYSFDKNETLVMDSTTANLRVSESLSSTASPLSTSSTSFWIPLAPSKVMRQDFWKGMMVTKPNGSGTYSNNLKNVHFDNETILRNVPVKMEDLADTTFGHQSDYYASARPLASFFKAVISRPEMAIDVDNTVKNPQAYNSWDPTKKVRSSYIESTRNRPVHYGTDSDRSYGDSSGFDSSQFQYAEVSDNRYYNSMMTPVDGNSHGSSHHGMISGNGGKINDYPGSASYSYGKVMYGGPKGTKYGVQGSNGGNGMTEYNDYSTEKGTAFLKVLFNKFLALLPIGLLLAIVLPNVVVIPSRRSLSDFGSDSSQKVVETYPILDMIDYYGGFESLKMYSCFKHIVCKTTRMGSREGANIFQKHLWKFMNW